MGEIRAFMATASVFLEEGNEVTKDYGFRFLEKNGTLDQNAPMEAITQAIGRALSNIGYGTQFCSPDEGSGMAVISDAPTKLSNGFSATNGVPTTPVVNQPVESVVEPTKGKRGRPRKEKTTDEMVDTSIESEFPNEAVPSTVSVAEPVVEAPVVAPTVATAVVTTSDEIPTTVEEAKKILIPFGQKKGQYMGEVLATDPSAVKWYAEKYTGNNEVVRAAAKLLMQ
jgi:hypothetical protein